MNFNHNSPLDIFLTELFDRYREAVPEVNQITAALLKNGVVSSQDEIVNDHIAFRTLGVPNLGIKSFEKIFLYHGYQKRDHYYFEEKKLDAYWYSPPSAAYPRIFLSELKVDQLSSKAQDIIKKYTAAIQLDPVDAINLNDGEAIAAFLHHPLWSLPDLHDYNTLLKESEYAAWVIYNRYYLNHYTISVHALSKGYQSLPDFNRFVEGLGIKLNDAGGKIKISADGLLSQSSTVAGVHEVEFADGSKAQIAGSYVEFAERSVLPAYSHLKPEEILSVHRREGFETSNADKIFESTYTGQIKS
ncbi:hypothetical protein HDF26_001584 [Pedobacter cryoconitis]|uniref:2-oxoadipate dioxygenase/decarboxylase n=1 Tax=Pedobacter cryoconitis TaxID=188932 RepID=A0A7W9E1D1_9SPHI|nr:DUF1338 domain-containing protein [Pedobacter cryoconitis]MBB5638214.1 hypothetical protein [Pedobacter cryoconitis]MBB6271157.1 hypothetical protein [Pedobacter cryoconitis]